MRRTIINVALILGVALHILAIIGCGSTASIESFDTQKPNMRLADSTYHRNQIQVLTQDLWERN